MTAWEGSAWQLEREMGARAREAEILRIQADNPWLSRQDCEEWQRRQEETRRPPPKCCPCQGRSWPGIVRVPTSSPALPGGSILGPCSCGCHGGKHPR